MSWCKDAKLSMMICILGQNCAAQIKESGFRKVIYKHSFQNKYWINYISCYLKSSQGAAGYLTHAKEFTGYRKCKEQPWFNYSTAQVHTKTKDNPLLLAWRPTRARERAGRLWAARGKQCFMESLSQPPPAHRQETSPWCRPQAEQEGTLHLPNFQETKSTLCFWATYT